MATVSKNWKFELNAAMNAEVAVMATGAFNLIGAAAVSYIERVYWTVPAVKADDVTKSLHTLMGTLGYNKSSKYELANAALAVARRWTKLYGAPNAAELNVFWRTVLDCETYADMSAFVVTAIKAEFKAETVNALYHALNPAKAGKAEEKTIPQKVAALVEKADAPDQQAIAQSTVAYLGEADRLKVAYDAIGKVSDAGLQAMFLAINEEMARRAAILATAEELAPTLKVA